MKITKAFSQPMYYVADHAVRAMSSFPYAENDYYGIPYHKRKGRNDLRRYNNIPVPTSYMVCETGYDFFGGYDHDANGGFIHVANRHIAPGKKQWTWGSAEFGQAWDRKLTDHGGPYFELMAGVYTDNQPDFTYLVPFETKTFLQFWWGYQKLGPVQNANRDLAIRLEILEANKLDLGVASSKKMEGLQFILKTGNETKIIENVEVSPAIPWQNKDFSFQPDQGNSISFIIADQSGKELLAYVVPNPMKRSAITHFILAWLYSKMNQKEKLAVILKVAAELNPDYFFPSRVQEQIVLEWAVHQDVDLSLVAYGLGNYYYDKKRHEEAIGVWELAAKKMEYGTLFRNLGIAYWNQREDVEKARTAFEEAVQLAPDDMRILFEYDQLRNEWENKFLIALAEEVLENHVKAQNLAKEILKLNAMHAGAKYLLSFKIKECRSMR